MCARLGTRVAHETARQVPFAPFSKTERLGRACDWYNQKNARFNQKFGGTNAAFDFTWGA